MERLNYIDWLRGFAIFLVVLGHVVSRCYGDAYLQSSLLRFILSFWMPLFVFISGYLSYKATYVDSILRYVKKKAITLLLPFFSVGLLYVLWNSSNCSTFFFSSLKMGYWFTFVLFQMSIVFYLFNQCFSWMGLREVVLDFVVIALPYSFVLLAYYLLPASVVDLLSLKEFIRLYVFFALGNFLHKYAIVYNMVLRNNWIYTFSLLIFFLSLRFLHYGEDVSIQDLIVRTITAFSAVLVLVRFFYSMTGKQMFFSKVLTTLGQYSLNIYLLHYFFLPDKVLSFSIESGGFIYDLLYAIIYLVPVIICCLILSRVIYQSAFLSLFLFGKNKKI